MTNKNKNKKAENISIDRRIYRAIHKIYFNMEWKDRRRIQKFLLFLQDKLHFMFDGIYPCIVYGKHEYEEVEYDYDRIFYWTEYRVRNIITGKKYTLLR